MKKLIVAFIFMVFGLLSQAQNPDDVVGVWINPKATGKIKIFRTGEFFYGNLIWIDKPLDEKGNPKLDDKNPDPTKSNRKIQGLLMLSGFTFDASEKYWQNGKIYDATSGTTYSCKMTMTDKNTLQIRGYVGISLIGRSETWTRVE